MPGTVQLKGATWLRTEVYCLPLVATILGIPSLCNSQMIDLERVRNTEVSCRAGLIGSPCQVESIRQARKATLASDSTIFTPNRTATFFVAGLGDSYASGEGNPIASPIDSTGRPERSKNAPANLSSMWGTKYGFAGCHRSDNAAVPQAFTRLRQNIPNSQKMQLSFHACGGADVSQLFSDHQGTSPNNGRIDINEQSDRWSRINQPPQLEQVERVVKRLDRASLKQPIDAIVMSIGGNTYGFGKVIVDCLKGGAPAGVDDEKYSMSLSAILNITSATGLWKSCNLDSNLSDTLNRNMEILRNDYARLMERLRTMSPLIQGTSMPNSQASRQIGGVYITKYAAGLTDSAGRYCGGMKNDIFGLISSGELAWIDSHLLAPLNREVDAATRRANELQTGPRWRIIDEHVARFSGKGPCNQRSSDRWTHSNNSALAAAGNNFPDVSILPSLDFRSALWSMAIAEKTALASLAAGAISPILAPAGAELGFIYAISDPKDVEISAGLAHPTEFGWKAIADAIYPALEDSLYASFDIGANPARVRQYSAVERRGITFRWDDGSTTETRYEIEILRDGTNQPYRKMSIPAGSNEYSFNPSGPFYGRAKVRACNPLMCTPFEHVYITNMPPTPPSITETKVIPTTRLGSQLIPASLLISGTNTNSSTTAVMVKIARSEQPSTMVNPEEKSIVFRVNTKLPIALFFGEKHEPAAHEAPVFEFGTYRVEIASCNIFGCSAYGPEKIIDVARPSTAMPNEAPLLSNDLRGIYFIDRFGDSFALPRNNAPTMLLTQRGSNIDQRVLDRRNGNCDPTKTNCIQ